jgi:hypothetical protein
VDWTMTGKGAGLRLRTTPCVGLLALLASAATAAQPALAGDYRGQCHGADFGAGASATTPSDPNDKGGESALVVLSEADMTPADGTDIDRTGDFNVTTRLIQYAIRRPAAGGAATYSAEFWRIVDAQADTK